MTTWECWAYVSPDGEINASDELNVLETEAQVWGELTKYFEPSGLQAAKQRGARVVKVRIDEVNSVAPERYHPEPVAKVISSGKWDFPNLQWLSANHSLETPIGSLLYLAPPHDEWMDKAARVRELEEQRDCCLKIDELEGQLTEANRKLEIAREALEKLSYVEGNGVARVALEKIGEGK